MIVILIVRILFKSNLLKFLYIIFLIFIFGCNDSESENGNNIVPEDSDSTWSLIWNEEFNGPVLDNNKWNILKWRPGWVNNELQAYTNRDTNLYFKDGSLVIRALVEPGYFDKDYQGNDYNSDYTSGRINTAGKFNKTYGRFDIRAKLPKGRGSWPAIWMLGENISSVGWPSCGEIDIMEMIGGSGFNDRTVYGTLHWQDNGSHANYGGSNSLSSGELFAEEFHVFSIIWDQNSIRFLRDDVQYHIMDIGGSELTEFHQNFFFIFNVAVGGNWPGSPDGSTEFPQTMAVDYVRVFQ